MKKILLAQLPQFAATLLQGLPGKKEGATVLALEGELGTGKTTFVQALAKELGIAETVQSPTYVLMKKYAIAHGPFTSLIHIDAYRLEKPAEFATLRPETFLNDPHALVAVEWPEHVAGALPQPDLTLQFSADGAVQGERYIEMLQSI